MFRTMIMAGAAAALFAAPQASAQSLLGALRAKAEQTLSDAIRNGESPSLPGARSLNSNSQGATGGGFQRYGNWDFRFDKLELGADEQWQAVLTVRNPEAHRQGMVASEISLFLVTEDGETLQNWGELYKAGVEGSSAGLEPVPGTMWLERGEAMRIRLRFDGSRGMKPAKLRIQSTGATAQARTFPIGY